MWTQIGLGAGRLEHPLWLCQGMVACRVGFTSKTQGLLAFSRSEGELYAVGCGVVEAIFARALLRDVNSAPNQLLRGFSRWEAHGD